MAHRGGGDINDCGNNTDFNRGSRDRASSREMEGMKELAKPSGYDPSKDDGCYEYDTDHRPTND